MRARLIAFMPVAAVITATLFGIAFSLVSALETRFDLETGQASGVGVDEERDRAESTCAEMHRHLDALARAATACEADPGCLVSPITCPVVMDEARALEYARLRDRLDDQCGITRAASYPSRGQTPFEARICGVSAEAVEPATASPTPETFVF